MSKIKIIIFLEDGLVSEVFSNEKVEYVIVDKDDESLDPYVINPPQNSKMVRKPLSLISIADKELLKALESDEFKDHPWLK